MAVSPKMTILQWNVRSVFSNKTDLAFLTKFYSVDIVILSETWLKPTQFFSFPGYHVYRSDRHDGYGGSAILIKKSIASSEIKFHQNFSFQVVGLKLKHFNLISVYNPPNCPVAELELNSLLKNIQSPLILAGDFNCHHTLWDPTCSRPDKGALNLLNFMDQQNLCVLNDGSPTLLGTPYRRESSVDLTICSPSLMSQSFWSVLNCTYGSDHFPILIKINDSDSHVPNFTPRRN